MTKAALPDVKAWLVETAHRLRADDSLPTNPAEARRRGEHLRRRIRESEREALPPPGPRTPPEARVLGVLDRQGYRIERLILETRAGVWATCNAYVPTGAGGKRAAVLAVHGHFAGARRDPVVQARCISLAKLGFFALAIDAWGAGERGTRAGINEYHGGLLGASLWPVGTPLHGLQLWDNMRALDYLQARPEVDGTRIGCTGASGGGNQTTYLSAFDERIKCAVPVCSVGTFASYLDAACCVDEMLDGALTFAEEGDLLGIVAPRALMVVTAARDTFHFGPIAAREAVERAGGYFRAHAAAERLRHVVIDSGHAYNQPMREAMYGWMKRWLQNEGDGSPIPEPSPTLEDPEGLRCYPSVRPGRVITTVRWVQQRAADLAAAVPEATPDGWADERPRRVALLRDLLRLPAAGEPRLPLVHRRDGPPDTPVAILANPVGLDPGARSGVAQGLRDLGFSTMAVEMRGCGSLVLPNQGLGADIPDHNLVEWSMWVGRPLLGQWVEDLLHAIELTRREGGRRRPRIALVGWREAGLAALLASALAPRGHVAGVAALETLASFQGEGPPHNQRMVVFHPGLMELGDIPHLAALNAPHTAVLMAGGVALDGHSLTRPEAVAAAAPATRVFRVTGAADRFSVDAALGDEAAARHIGRWLAQSTKA